MGIFVAVLLKEFVTKVAGSFLPEREARADAPARPLCGRAANSLPAAPEARCFLKKSIPVVYISRETCNKTRFSAACLAVPFLHDMGR